MEIARATSKSGVVYRLWEDFAGLSFYTIEYLKVYPNQYGTESNAWFPAYEPRNKVFNQISEARKAFEDFLEK